MCGILGIIGDNGVASSLVEGLKRLEYRGYDSAGIATLDGDHIGRRRARGKLINLARKLEDSPLAGDVGIGHTRWATHGPPSEINAHPHATDLVAVVHNGIIENYKSLRSELESEGAVFQSETDTETIAHLVTRYRRQGMSPAAAASMAFPRLEGAFALALIFAGEHDILIGARRGSPLAVGYGEGRMYLASDAMALAPFTSRLSYLQDGDWVELRHDRSIFRDFRGQVTEREIRMSHVSAMIDGKSGHRHYMHKEMHQQPEVIRTTLEALLDPLSGEIVLPPMAFDLATIPRLSIVSCGTGYYASLVAEYWIEQLAGIPVDVDIASEFRYRAAPMPPGGVALFVSQSGETADTLEAMRYARRMGQHVISIVNVPESTMARDADAVIYTLAGPEICVASTKATTSQLTVLACFAIALARAKGLIAPAEQVRLGRLLRQVPDLIDEVLSREEQLKNLARMLVNVRDVLYIGRGNVYPVAMEGALKLKEISYIHAEGYAAGEMKHGPIALIDEQVPVIVLAPFDDLFRKTASNVEEVAARGGRVFLISDARGIEALKNNVTWTFEMPDVPSLIAPIIYMLPIQLLAYYVAVLKGTDVDQPRNLAKSVTVE